MRAREARQAVIRFEGASKQFVLREQTRTVLAPTDLILPTGRPVALLGRNGAGKSTLLKMISGVLDPSAGRIVTRGTVSWPVGFAGAFHPDLTGAQNTRFLARVYGIDTGDLSAFVEDFAELGPYYRQPLRSYSAGMKARLAFGVSMGIPFDTYLVDEVTAVGDGAFRKKATELFQARLAQAGAIVVSHSLPQLRALTEAALVLEGGRLRYFEDLEAAITLHQRHLAA